MTDVVKPRVRLVQIRLGVGLGLISLAIGVVGCLATFGHIMDAHSLSAAVGAFFLSGPQTSLFLLTGGVLLIATNQEWQRERRRQAGAQGNRSVPLAQEQPQPDPTALSLPVTIRLRPSWPRLLLCLALYATLPAGGAVVARLLSGEDFGDPKAILAYWFIVAVLIGPFAALWAHQRIEVSQKGLKVGGATVYWAEEPRLFAIASPGKQDQPPIRYELAGPFHSVRWIRCQRRMPLLLSLVLLFEAAVQPVLPFNQYDQQMDALLALVAAKTGLPLLDLRQ